MMAGKAHYLQLAAYNQWANARLYAAAARLHEADYLKARPSFFGSLHGTLNHILVADRLWLARFERRPAPAASLNHMLYADLIGLRVAREAEDAHVIRFFEGLDETRLAGDLTYESVTERKTLTLPFGPLCTHFFNHQTHHRGQAHGLLSQTEVAPPELDFVYFLLERR